VRATDEMLLLYPLLKRAERYPLNSSARAVRDALALLEAVSTTRRKWNRSSELLPGGHE